MSAHKISLHWARASTDFTYETYDRTHTLGFEGGQKISASSAPEFLGKSEHVNPEEMLAAALSSCHMLTFLAIAAKSRYTLDRYDDEATAHLEKNAEGKLAVTQVILHPRVAFSGDKQPNAEQIAQMHEKAHRNCFIASSVKCDVRVEAP